jgi:RNA polymerase sigma factor (sigma-70 family)
MTPLMISEFEKLRPGLVRYFQMKGCRDDQSEELAQETLYRVWHRFNNSAEPSVLGKAFADAVAHNVIHEWWRARQRVRQIDPDLPEQPDPRPGILTELIEGLETRQKLECFRRCCSRLKPLHRRLFDQYYKATAEGRETLAAELEISIEDLRARISYIKGKIRRCMNVRLSEPGSAI